MVAYKRQPSRGRTHAKNKLTQPFTGNVLDFSDLQDRTVRLFWFIELASTASFLFWLVVATALSRIPITFDFLPARDADALPNFNTSSVRTSADIPADNSGAFDVESSSNRVSIDVWFSLSLTVALDALAVVFTFNRALIRRFHYAVSQRMMFLASMVSYAVFSWNHKRTTFVELLLLGFALYMLLDYALDIFEKRLSFSGLPARWGTIQQYSQDLGHFDMSWKRAQFLTLIIGGFGLCLTIFISPPWTALVPVLHILFESAFLSVMKAKRTPRYLILCSPLFFATICVHWGVMPLASDQQLAIKPWAFLVLVLFGRLLLDAHLWTTLRSRPELQWARKEVVVSTRKLLTILVAMVLLEYMGVKVITYIKPITVLTFFGLSSTGFLAVGAYNLAVKNSAGHSSSCN